MAHHDHIHIHDSGTSEGARKAAQTRKQHSGGAAAKPNPYGTTRYAHLLHRWEGNGPKLSEHEGVEFAKLHREHTEGRANHLAPSSTPAFRVGPPRMSALREMARKPQGLLERRRTGYKLGHDASAVGAAGTALHHVNTAISAVGSPLRKAKSVLEGANARQPHAGGDQAVGAESYIGNKKVGYSINTADVRDALDAHMQRFRGDESFKKVERSLAHKKGVRNPKALAAWIGRKNGKIK